MRLTKGFNDLVQDRAANDPGFAAALRGIDRAVIRTSFRGMLSGVRQDGVARHPQTCGSPTTMLPPGCIPRRATSCLPTEVVSFL
jgi:hypothetical protein